MSNRILLASLVGIGTGSESTDGGGDTNGEVGRDETRLTSLLLDEVFFSFGIVDVVFWSSETRNCDTGGTASDSKGGCDDGPLRSSFVVSECEPADEKEPTLCLLSAAGVSC